MMIELSLLDKEFDPNFMEVEQKILLYKLVFLKVYAPNEEAHCSIVDWPCKRTFRKWSWYFIEQIFLLQGDVIDLKKQICRV